MARKDCAACAGSGADKEGYGRGGRCYDCWGTGKELTLEDRELFEMIEKFFEMRRRYGTAF